MPFWLFFLSEASYGRYAAILIDGENGSVLHEVEATQPWYPASLTKVMTLYMAFEALDAGHLHLYDNLTASYHVSRQPNSKLGLRTGENLTVEEAILAVITRSANDAAVALAERLGGTEDNFAIKMTAKARALGMYNTRFMNATGLPNDWQITTSRDMAILALKIKHNFPNYYPYFSSHSFYYKGRELRGINKFTAKYPGAEGMKTGFTCGSGFNLIGAASQNGKNLIGVVLGGMTSAERYQLMMNMMDNGFGGAYAAGSGRNINTMTTGFGGEPPYQLSCGKGAGNHAASSVKSAGYSRHHSKPRLAGKSKRYGKTRVAGKSKRYSKKTLLAKNKGVTAKIKTAGKTRKVAAIKSAGKGKHGGSSKTPAATKKLPKSTKVKKVAGSATSKRAANAKAGKSKGYHRPG
jgi:D-alanyl-D-alanine carboxypeptidase (penicillin-binding protein 5/6)